MTDNLVIYHGGGCPDGFAAALAAWLKLGDSADYFPSDYSGEEIPDVTGKYVYILDYSFDAAVMQRMREQAKQVVLLDHHETAVNKLLGHFCPSCSYKGPKLFVNLDLSKSGARLAWEYFHPNTDIPMLISRVEDMDLWRFTYSDTKAYIRALRAVPMTFERWRQVLNMTEEENLVFVSRGMAMLEAFESLCEALADKAVPLTLAGETGLMVNATSEFSSDLGELLARRSGTFGAVWTLEKSGLLKVSLRSKEGYRVKELAERFGGGGHPRAAALRLSATRFPELASGVIND